MPVEVYGSVAEGFESLEDTACHVASRHDAGAFAFAAHHRGQLVADLWAGCARDALFHTWSVVKPVTGACLLHSIERARADVRQPVAQLWPNLRAAVDTGLTIEQVLGHAAGLVTVPGGDARLLVDRQQSLAALEATAPDWGPGTAVGEHALTFGHLVDALLLALDGRDARNYWREEIGGPAGLDLWVGLPRTQADRVLDDVGLDTNFWRRSIGSSGSLRHRALCGGISPALANSAEWRAADIPAVNGYATARAVSAFYDLWLRRELPAAFSRSAPPQRDLVLERDVAWTLAGGQRNGSWVGMGGVGGQLAGADAAFGASWAFLTSEMGTTDRANSLVKQLVWLLRQHLPEG